MKQLTTKQKLRILKKIKILCWSALILAFILKILGVYYVDKGLNVEWLINLNTFVSNRPLIQHLISYIGYMFVAFLMVLIVSKKKSMSKRKNVIIFVVTTLSYILRCSIPSLSLVADIVGTFVLPICLSEIDKIDAYARCWVMFLFINIFQIISLLTRRDELKVIDYQVIYNMVVLVDYYIMFYLYYLYSIEVNKRSDNMANQGFWWFGGELAHDKGYRKFKQVTSYIGMVAIFPTTIPVVLCKRHQLKKKYLEK